MGNREEASWEMNMETEVREAMYKMKEAQENMQEMTRARSLLEKDVWKTEGGKEEVSRISGPCH